MGELHVNKSNYMKNFPRFDRPNIIGYIGLENLKFAKDVKNCDVRLDLNLHLDKVIRKPTDLDVKLTCLLQFLHEHSKRLSFPIINDLEKARFYCYRGLLTCVACTPYENREPWKIVVILYKGDIYMCARDTEEKLLSKNNMTERDKQFTSWGYKFEQYILSDAPQSAPDPDKPVDETEEFSLVFTTQLNRHTLVYGAEMDGIRCDEPVETPPTSEANPKDVVQYLSTKKFIELKTNRHIEFPNQDRNFKRYKSKKWWCQSFLVGIDNILCGFRNDDGIVEELKLFSVKELPKLSHNFWDPNVCFNFLDTFLTYVKRCLHRKIKQLHGDKAFNNLQNIPMTTLLLEWSPGCPVRPSDHYNHDDDPILPQWYLESGKWTSG